MSYVICGKSSGGHLIEQWKKCLKVVAIYNCDIGIFGQRFSGGEPAETRAKNYDARSCGRSHSRSLGSEL
jgi:hypothetical protein